MKRVLVITMTILAASGVAMASSAAFAEACKTSQWGGDDEIGAANHVTPDRVLMAAGLIRKGESHPLGIVIDPDMPTFPPRGMMLQVVQPNQQHGRSLAQDFGWPMTYNDDLSQVWWGMGPQIDGLGHVGEEGVFYNCNEGKDIAAVTGLTKLGIHTIPPLVGRGVLIDMAEHFGVQTMSLGQGIRPADIRAAAKEQGVEIRNGDIVLFHTGWTDALLESDPDKWNSGEPGLTNAAAEYLASLDIMAVGADTFGVEAIPPVEGDKIFYGHVTFLKENGIYILETMNTGRLAREDVHEFMFILGQARVKGAVQMMINPVAIW